MFESEQDLGAFFGDFSTTIVATPAEGETFTFQGIFDDAFFNPEIGEMSLDTSSPRLTARASDASRLSRGDTITINGESYSVYEVQPEADRKTATIILAHE